MNYTRWFETLRITDRPTVGGKCASLGELIHAGVDVPDGFAVTVDAFECFRDQGTLRADLKRLVRTTDTASSTALDGANREATAMVCGTGLPTDVEAEIRQAYSELAKRCGDPALPVAVRSSAVAEDGDAASFAGQQETYLWVVGADELIESVRLCWASLYTPQAIAYRASLPEEVAADATRISVGVQAMVDAEVSGVAFTVSPRTGDRSVVAVNASYGLGHAIVSGEVTPDEFWLSKIGPAMTSMTVAHKTMQCLPNPDGHGVQLVEVPADLQDVACMTEEAVLALAEVAMRVESHYGTPQDIEWALTRATASRPTRIVLLQSRPETTWKTRQAETRAKTASSGAASYLSFIHQAGTKVSGG